MVSSFRAPAPRPCDSCPYRRDVPPGIWAYQEYEKLRRYDAPTPDQPVGVFQCHQADEGSSARRICAGWAGCHDGAHLLALRIALLYTAIDDATFQAATGYVSPIALFSSGAEAADHGQAAVDGPDPRADQLRAKIVRARSDLST